MISDSFTIFWLNPWNSLIFFRFSWFFVINLYNENVFLAWFDCVHCMLFFHSFTYLNKKKSHQSAFMIHLIWTKIIQILLFNQSVLAYVHFWLKMYFVNILITFSFSFLSSASTGECAYVDMEVSLWCWTNEQKIRENNNKILRFNTQKTLCIN